MDRDSRSEPGLSSTTWETLRPGARFVVRRRLPDGDTHAFTDTVGDVVKLSADAVVVRTRRHGDVAVPRPLVIAVKEIPPTPGRRGRPHRAIGIEDLERLSVDGWPPRERASLGSWILRAADGYTGRANAALALGQPDAPLAEALKHVSEWYSRRGLPPLIHVPLPPGCRPDADPLVAEATATGWEWFQFTEFMTAATADVLRAAPGVAPDVRIEQSTGLTDAWWALADERMRENPEGAEHVLTAAPDQVLFVAHRDDVPAARARIAFAHGWGGVFAVATAEESRRRGLAGMLVGQCARAAAERGVSSLYLQVSADNASAIALYERLGFTSHHQYVYLRRRMQ